MHVSLVDQKQTRPIGGKRKILRAGRCEKKPGHILQENFLNYKHSWLAVERPE